MLFREVHPKKYQPIKNAAIQKNVAKIVKKEKAMKIEVVGTGCATCQQLHKITQLAASRIGPEAEVTYVSTQDGMKRLMELGLMRSPALVVDGNVVLVGYESSIEKVKDLILNRER